MSYTAPLLTVEVVLDGSYTPPGLTTPVVLGAATIISGTLAATLLDPVYPVSLTATGDYLHAPTFSATLPDPAYLLSLTARQRPVQGANSLWMDGLHRPPPPTLAATCDVVHTATLAASLPDPLYPLICRARERSIVITLSAAMPAPTYPLTLNGTADFVQALALTIPFTTPTYPLSLDGAGAQDLVMLDADGPRLSIREQPARPTATGSRIAQQSMLPIHTPARLMQTGADPIRVGTSLLQTAGLRVQTRVVTPQTHGVPVTAGVTVTQTETLRTHWRLRERHAHGLPVRHGSALLATETLRTRTRRVLAAQHGAKAGIPLLIGQQQARLSANRLRLRWTQADQPSPGRWWPFYIVPGLSIPVILDAPYTPRPLRCPVRLSWRWIAQPYCVGFDPAPPGVIIPVQEIYVVINTFSLVRADTGQVVDALDFSASLDADSWGWSWSATVPASQMSRVRSPELGEWVELIATLNGTALRCVVERLSRSRQFGSSALKISGRGRAAWLAEPNSPIITVMNAETRTAQQLLNDALTVNSVSLGWTVDWQLEDWSVPAGAWSYTGTYIGAAQRLAESGGGYVQADAALQTLHILPYYPTAPWQWATETPDVGLPDAVCTTEDLEWQDRPAYNAVWVVGQDQGRRDLIKRAGTAGDVLAPTVVDPLATDTIMTRQRGLRVIADTGRQVHVSVKLPILAETGIIMPGTLLEYTEQGQTHLGLSRAVSVQWGFPDAWQTIKVETHELESV